MNDLAQLGVRVKRDTMSDSSSSGGAKGAWGRVRELASNTLRAHPTCTLLATVELASHR